MSTQPQAKLTLADYLTRERSEEGKSEYYDGELFAMGGATERHNLIVAGSIMSLGSRLAGGTRLAGRPCRVYPSGMRVKITPTGLYTYPDLLVVCGEPEFEDDVFDTLLNPTVLIEVLSKTTEAYDRGTKAEHYRQIPSLRHHVLIAQNRPHVEVFTRHDQQSWRLIEATGLHDSVALDGIGCELPLCEVYQQVDFGAEEDRLWRTSSE